MMAGTATCGSRLHTCATHMTVTSARPCSVMASKLRVGGRSPQPGAHDYGCGAADQLCDDEGGRAAWGNACERVGDGTRHRHGWIGERRGSGEPVRGGDVQPDRV